MEDVDCRGAVHGVGQGGNGNSQYVPLNFAMNLQQV